MFTGLIYTMKVSISKTARKEAEKLKAESFFQQAIDMLKEKDWGYLMSQKHVEPMQGKNLAGAYEVKPGGLPRNFRAHRE